MAFGATNVELSVSVSQQSIESIKLEDLKIGFADHLIRNEELFPVKVSLEDQLLQTCLRGFHVERSVRDLWVGLGLSKFSG